MDAVDLAIIAQLTKNGRMSNQDLAQEVGLTPAPCLRRVRNLEELGVIQGYRAEISPGAIDQGFEAIVLVNLNSNKSEETLAFEERILAMPEVIEFRRMFSQPDYLLRVAVKDIGAYEQWMSQTLQKDPEIERFHSHITMKVLRGLL
ncbi:AsnC family transcriptional regulator [Corynebacterium kutscheri]|uniref:AsnC family transcriptional regulator n=1 Tax=Corynebacterium kutscheri TaxID=35755 RepID=A0A0F6QYW3_9CORY|nr:Lrp/AsnC family transcriptional regulator [Corynebacterium kutscheri]AKE40822.1 transcriptional regulator, AsnC family [Corynebacterium kutscheri]VEH06526.1 AsnC family transcriptional regulator [Corynebacterium kutscheri]VEH09119.1 AsnC family transcriptional regulator [Corynebacterium kutscheri]VEH82444.1 AsnC family transcriptional regulator [Corynebacterium kutscheri]